MTQSQWVCCSKRVFKSVSAVVFGTHKITVKLYISSQACVMRKRALSRLCKKTAFATSCTVVKYCFQTLLQNEYSFVNFIFLVDVLFLNKCVFSSDILGKVEKEEKADIILVGERSQCRKP